MFVSAADAADQKEKQGEAEAAQGPQADGEPPREAPADGKKPAFSIPPRSVTSWQEMIDAVGECATAGDPHSGATEWSVDTFKKVAAAQAAASDDERKAVGDRLKAWLSAVGLKCGGSLDERVERLYFATEYESLEACPNNMKVREK